MLGLEPDPQDYFLCSFYSEYDPMLQSFQFYFREGYISFSPLNKGRGFSLSFIFLSHSTLQQISGKVAVMANGHFKFKPLFQQLYAFIKITTISGMKISLHLVSP